MQHFAQKIRDHFLFMTYAPILFVSAMSKKRLHKLLPLINHVSEQHSMRVQTHVLNDLIYDAVTVTPPPTDKGRRLKISYATQVAVKPPTFILFVNNPELMHFSYERFLENKIRAAFTFEGTPIRIMLRKKSEEE